MPDDDPDGPDDRDSGRRDPAGNDDAEHADGDGESTSPPAVDGEGTAPGSGGEDATDNGESETESTRESGGTTPSPPPAGGASDAAGDGGAAASGDRGDSRPTGPVEMVREVLTSAAMVLLIGGVLFAASGVWPPLVAVESGSMEPHMFKGDLVFVSENGRYAPDDAVAGVVTYRQGKETGYRSFGSFGNVIVYQPDGRAGTPVIHRARMYVEAGENWVERADPQYLGGERTCAEIVTCPAPHDGYITRGDANPRYDQVGISSGDTLSTVVKPEWVRGNAKVRVPFLGCIRLELSGTGCDWPLVG